MAARRNDETPAEVVVESVETQVDPVIVTTDQITEAVQVEEGYTRLLSPLGSETTVPDSILEALLESGYTEV